MLDEPIAGLDLAHQLQALDLLRATVADGRAAVVALHDLSLAARSCHRMLLLADGELRADAAPSAVLTPENLARYFGVEAEVRLDREGRPLVVPIAAIGRRSRRGSTRDVRAGRRCDASRGRRCRRRSSRTSARAVRGRVGAVPRRRPRPSASSETVVVGRRDGDGPREDRTGAASVVRPGESPRAYDDLGTILLEVPGVTATRTGSLGAFSHDLASGAPAPTRCASTSTACRSTSRQGGAVDISTLPLGDVERVEVYRGTSPLAFGESALGGIVSITTRTPGDGRA